MKTAKHQIGSILLWAAIVLLIVMGLILRFAVVGFSFLALVCFFLAALLLAYRGIALLASKYAKPAKILRTVLTACVCVGFLIVTVTGVLVAKASLGQPDQTCQYVVVLGAGLHGSTPSMSLQDRLDAACEYLSAHPEMICVVSGGQGPDEDMSEAQCMFNILTERGIDPARILIEDRSTSTQENLQYSLDLIEKHTGIRPDEIGLLSSEYHLFRAGLFAQEQGVTAYGIPAKTSWPALFINYFLREIAGVWHYILLGS
ncbi:MAG: YdcF family protein [Oscillospiraceae bacterium]|nr:YdcF family protein [Oscillospiraceae bacterium]